MNSKTRTAPGQAQEHDRIFRAAFAAVSVARERLVNIRPHRSITPLTVTPWLLVQAIGLPLLLCGLIYLGKPMLMDFWRECILFWSNLLNIPFTLSPQLDSGGQHPLVYAGGLPPPRPGATTLWVTALVTLGALVLSFRMKHAKLPLKYPLRIFVVVQAGALLYFWLLPGGFPYSMVRHSEELMTIGYAIMLATPVMLGVGYYILNQSFAVKLVNTALILGFLIIMVPHQVLAQAFIMHHLSVLFMPVLYICFGAVFDALVFVALYSWAVSNAPSEATV